MIKIINGATRIGRRIVTANDEPFNADPGIESSLVARGVAVFVAHVATPLPCVETTETSENLSEEENAAEGAETSEEEDLSTKKLSELKEIAEEMGIDASKMRTKAEVISAITSAEDDFPDLGTDGDVV